MSRMMEDLLLPALLSALLSIGLCAFRVYQRRRPSFLALVWSILAVGCMMLLLAYGSSLVRWSFWSEHVLEVLVVFGMFGLASLIPSLFVVVLYRIRYVDADDFAEPFASNSRPPSQFPSSPEVQSSDSPRTPSSGGCP
jgi:hypothetical protein